MKTLRVLIVEDEPLLAMDLESIVTDTVSAAVIVKSSVAGAKIALRSPVDVAFLDVDVTNGKTFDLARMLDREHIPYAFVSGSRAEELPLELQNMPFFHKPVGRSEIERLLRTVSASSEETALPRDGRLPHPKKRSDRSASAGSGDASQILSTATLPAGTFLP